MFERLCALLLRLYPAEFRDAYGRDALQLMRDRARDERGLVLRVRLCLDLLRDVFAMSMSGWQAPAPMLTAAAGSDVRVPSFHIIEQHGPRPAALAAGMFASMLMFASFAALVQARYFADGPARLGDISDGEPSSDLTGDESDDSTGPDGAGDSDPRRLLVRAVANKLKEHYVDRIIGDKLAGAVLTADRNGGYASALMDAGLAARITFTIHNTARALGIPSGQFVADVVYSKQPIPEGPPPPQTPEMREQRRSALLEQNCLFEKTETLPRNIGYVKLNGFPEAAVCQQTTQQIMTAVNSADALILDLRDNGGGFGDTALQIAGYLFDRPATFFDPRAKASTTTTTTPVSGSTLTGTPVYLLTSPRTRSAAEYFTYNLKMLKRATIVGERTAGQQHSGAFHRLNNHFGMGIQQDPLPVNPFPVKGWEGIGVEPDIKALSTDALDAAIGLVRRK